MPSYLKSDECDDGWFVSIRYRDKGASLDRLRLLPHEVRLVADRTGKNFRYKTIDARQKLSASGLTVSDDETDLPNRDVSI